jgi:hypothetical protein
MKTLFKNPYSESVIICMIILFYFPISDIFTTHIAWKLTFSREKEITTKCYDDYISISNNNFAINVADIQHWEKTQNNIYFTVGTPEKFM